MPAGLRGNISGRRSRLGHRPPRRHQAAGNDRLDRIPQFVGLFIGSPGMMKSPAMQAALAPIHYLEAEAAKQNEVAREAYKANIDAFKLRQQVRASLEREALKKGKAANFDPGVEPEEPVEIRYRTNDSTYEAIGELLIDNPMGLLIERDELVSLLHHLDREEQIVARSFYMSGWAGTQPYTFDRIIRGHRAHRSCVLEHTG